MEARACGSFCGSVCVIFTHIAHTPFTEPGSDSADTRTASPKMLTGRLNGVGGEEAIAPVVGWPPANPRPFTNSVTVSPTDAGLSQLFSDPSALRATGSRLLVMVP